MVKPARSLVLLWLLLLLLFLGGWLAGGGRSLDRTMFDVQIRWLRQHAPTLLPRDVVVVGLDEAAYQAIAEPYALWHRHWGDLLTGLAQARPAVVGLAAPLPVRSYDFLVPGGDRPLLDGVQRLRQVAPVFFGLPRGVGSQLRPLAPELVTAAGGASAVASLVLCEDVDGTVRALGQRDCGDAARYPSLADAMTRALGRQGAVSGLIDFSLGGPLDYLPVQSVLAWARQGDVTRLRQQFEGRIVVVASLLPSEVRYRLPAALAAWAPGERALPAALGQIQALRSMLGGGLISTVAVLPQAVLLTLASLLWWGHSSQRKLLVLALAVLAVLLGTTWSLWRGQAFDTGALLLAVVLAYLVRLAWDAARHYQERRLLRGAFAGHVSPQVMRAILQGELLPAGRSASQPATILFADMRGFTARAEHESPEAMIELLNRYYAEAAAAVHAAGGTVDKFIGDGVMAIFGLPQSLPNAPRNALEAAQELLLRLERVNDELRAQARAPVQVGIGIQSGMVIAGYVGNRKRRDFTVIGDAVNTASRLEGLTKELGFPVVCGAEVAAAVGFAGGLQDLGERTIRGHSALQLWGWRPGLTQTDVMTREGV